MQPERAISLQTAVGASIRPLYAHPCPTHVMVVRMGSRTIRGMALSLALLGVLGCSAADGGSDIVSGADTGGVVDEDTGDPGEDTGTTDEDTGSVADSTPPPKDTGTAPVDTGTPPPPDTGSGDGWPAAWAALEDQVLTETNARRALGANCGGKIYGAAKPLAMHPKLRTSARLHSKDMADKNYFSHTGLDGTSPFDRMKAAGYSGTTMGENIAAGYGTAKQTVQQWMDSPGHCENIMNPAYTHLGVGYAYNASSTYKHYWTQNFGAGG